MNTFDEQRQDFFTISQGSICLKGLHTVDEIRKACTLPAGSRLNAIFQNLVPDIVSRPGARILELGVYTAGAIKAAYRVSNVIGEYIGVDDYGLDPRSPYIRKGGYWPTVEAATESYFAAKAVFDSFHQPLHRMTSSFFLKQLERPQDYDIVFVDANHQYEAAFADMQGFFKHVRPGGVMLVDDYDNVQHPGVTKAVTEFICEQHHRLAEIRALRFPFCNAAVVFPVSQTILALFKRDS